MAWQPYSPYEYSWTPLVGNNGDLGLSPPQYEDTSYHGHSGVESDRSGGARSLSGGESYELSDRRSTISSAPLLQPDNSSTYKSSVIEPEIRETASYGRKRGHHPSGWKAGVMVCATTAVMVCLLNTTLTIWAVTNHELVDGLSYLYTGSCQEVAKMSLWIHLGINAMSTMLLSASNYTMQVISSPTRKEVDDAHAKSRWLDIGIPSTRNLRSISWGRITMWIILGLSSVPLHLMYNTAVFSSLSANAYDYIVVSEDFFDSSAVYNASIGFSTIDILNAMHEAAVNGSLSNYTSAECMTMYGTTFVSKARNVLLVTNTRDTTNNSVLASQEWDGTQEIPYSWICGDGWDGDPYADQMQVCTTTIAQAAATDWTVSGHHISYCMVEVVEEKCQLSFSLVIMLIVIAVNASKACIMILTAWKLNEPTLVTIGDAVASFLKDPDPTTEGICLSTKMDIQKKKWKLQTAKPWAPKKHFWFRAASVKRWLICNILCIGVIGLGIFLLTQGMDGIDIYNIKALWELGFGTVSANSVVTVAPTGLIATTLFANLPQGVLSFLYLTYNGLFSCMLGALEWNRFGRFRKPLRVTAPEGTQRSTYYLQLPYTYAIPLLLMSGGLHWLMSQSLFLALVNVYDDDGEFDAENSISTVGYSCIAIFAALIVGGVAVVCGIANGFRKYDDGIPLVGSCSAAISAACHPPKEDSMAHLMPVKWGKVESDPGSDGVGHCCFTSFEVERPVSGNLYAGTKEKYS